MRMKEYLQAVLERCAQNEFAQDAITWAIQKGAIAITYELERDVRVIMQAYDVLVESYKDYVLSTPIERH